MTAANNNHKKTMGWKFDNSYARLPKHFYKKLSPTQVTNPNMVIINHTLADVLGLSFKAFRDDELSQLFSGNLPPKGSEPLAQAYAGHQFGYFTHLGDGRAHLFGEHITPKGNRVDITLKGSGKTPFSRGGDGRAALAPMLREYIISEAMHFLGIPTTRSLAVVTTGEPILRETTLQGAILTRIASSHLRVGTFEFLAAEKDKRGLTQLADYAINRHYPDLLGSEKPYVDFLKIVMKRQILLISEWLRVGFIHGVMNTDNMTISGETIDYGPCAFMDNYHPDTVYSSIDHDGRYAYANQPHIAQWNLARFAETLMPILHEDIETAAIIAQEIIEEFPSLFKETWVSMMRDKLGLIGQEKEDIDLIDHLLKWMQKHNADYTNTFRDLISTPPRLSEKYNSQEFNDWYSRWQQRLDRNNGTQKQSIRLMCANNPVFIPRNHNVEHAISLAENNSDFSKVHELVNVLSLPYKEKAEFSIFKNPPKPEELIHQTFCGT